MKIVFPIIKILLVILRSTLCVTTESFFKYEEGKVSALDTFHDFYYMLHACMLATIPDQHLLVDDLKNFVNYPAKTTVGFAPKFTSNRKFFANMITSRLFREMLARDEEEMRKAMIKKLKYCTGVVMDPNILKEFYDGEIDNTKL